MSYTELESGYQDLKQASRPGFFVGHDGNGDIDMCGENNDGMDSDCSVSSNSGKQVMVGVCAMAKKTQSKPMKEILTRLQEFEYIKMVVFSEEVILKELVEKWPICDCLISFHSKGFPLEKAIQYAQLRKPFVINNLHMQYDIQDRRRVYAILESEGIEIPRYAVLDRESPDPKQHELIESEDHVEVNGVIFNKPFVEKPVSAEDHNIYIYYPTSAGGGSQRLFRKIGSRSSVYSPESRVRKTGSFIYEDFMPTDGLDIKVYTVGPHYIHAEARKNPIMSGLIKGNTTIGTDVKVYTVGPDYAHAEARKSPALDGKVERDSEGKEIRYPVILNNAEKLISRKVCLAFKQTVCGFDLLRANGKSYVCDVNGFSFVKNSNKYYDDCAKILGNMILRELTPTLHIPWSVPFQLDDPPIVPTTFGKMMELRCVVAVIRHGDRTPKQKMKVEVRHPKFFEIFEKYDGYKQGHVKLKRPKQLQEILDIARSLLDEIKTKAADCEIEEKQGKLEQLKSVLEMYGHFSGINRKVQMKYQPKGRPRGSSSDDGNGQCNVPKEPSLVLILKWGGELTPAGRIQAEELGRIFRCMYPGGQGRHDYSGTQGLGLLRLHSTFRHDLKIYASDEGRVQMTAAAFAKGLLALEGELTPILVQMVKSANTNGLLDNDCDSSKYQNMAKNRLHELMQINREFTKEDREAINPGNSISINQAMDFVKNPVKCCAHVHSLIQTLLQVINVKKEDPKTKDAILYHGETWDLMGRRWEKIEKDFSTKSKTFDISKIPDIYDCIKYDLQHNQHTLQYEQAEELYLYAKYLADIVIPQEYGLTIQEKLAIGQGICTPLLKKIKADLQRNIEEPGDESVNRLNPRYSHGVSSPGRHVRTRLYFTSESHVHSLLTVLRFGGLLDVIKDEQWRRAMEYISMVSELNYMSQIVIMLYEDPTKDPSSEERFHVELHFSPGVNCCVQKNLPPGPGFRPHSRNDSAQSKNISPDDSAHTRIDEENDVNLEDSPPHNSRNQSEQTSPEEQSEISALPQSGHRTRHYKASKPIPIGAHHTVCGHEAMDLAKRLSEELAAQQAKQTGSLEVNRPLSPEAEPRSRSYEQRHQKTKENCCNKNYNQISVVGCIPLYKVESSTTNELPLSEIDFSITPRSPEILIIDNPLDDHPRKSSSHNAAIFGSRFDNNSDNLNNNGNNNNNDCNNQKESRRCISPTATNECPLSCNCLVSLYNDDDDMKKSKFTNKQFAIISKNIKNHTLIAQNQHSFFSSADNISKISDITILSTDALRLSNSMPAIFENSECNNSLSDIMYKSNTLGSYAYYNDSSQSNLVLPDKKKTSTSFLLKNNDMNSINTTSQSQVSPLPLNTQVIPAPPPPQSSSSAILTKPLPTESLNLSYKNYLNVSTPSIAISFVNDDEQNDKSPVYPTLLPIQSSLPLTNFKTSSFDHLNTLTNLNPNTIPPHHPIIDKMHHNSENTTSASSSSSASSRRQRHSIAGQMSYIKMLGFGGFGKKMATSTNSLFSTAVISGSSSAPNLRDMIPSTATPSVLEGFGGVPPIRPLETLHNALSLKQLDVFLEKMTTALLFKTPASSPPKYPSTPVPTPIQTPQNSIIEKPPPICSSWSEQSSVASSTGTEPSSPAISESHSRGQSSAEISISLISNEGTNILPVAEEILKYFPKLDEDLNSIGTQLDLPTPQSEDVFFQDSENCLTPISFSSDFNTAAATKGSTTDGNDIDDDEATLSIDTCPLIVQEETEAANKTVNLSGTKSAPPGKRTSPPRIQKQISLFESERIAAAESRITLQQQQQQLGSRINIRRRKFGTVESSFLAQSTSNDSLSLNYNFTAPSKKESITKSCINLKSCSTVHHPGALLVKEMFIDPPKRITRSFHGKTGREKATEESSSELCSSFSHISDCGTGNRSAHKLRFITTKIDENKDNK